jgi:DNA repair ATPase RecN
MKFQKYFVGVAIAAALAIGGGVSAYAADTATPSAQEQQDHQGKFAKEHKKLTEEQKQAIKDAGIDFKANKEQWKAFRDTHKSIKEARKQLEELASKDKQVKKQIKADLASTEADLAKLKALKESGRDLHKQLHDAIEAADSAKIKDAYGKLQANKQEAYKLMQTIDAALQAELKKVQG